MSMITDKARKVVCLGLNECATEGEWQAASAALLLLWRRDGLSDEDLFPVDQALEEPQGLEVMTFGRYKGQMIVAIPTGYLQWLMTKADGVSDALRNRISYELSRRSKM